MNLLQTTLMSVVEGITEFLPISSTGHMILLSNFLKLEQTEFLKSFEIIIQLGAILSVVVIYFKKLIASKKLWIKILIAFLPSAVFGLIFYQFIKNYLIGNNMVVVLSLLIGGVIMIIFEKFVKIKKTKDLSELQNRDFLVIGVFQVFSMIPGVSRAFATIFGGLITGLSRREATEFSFYLAIPTMFAAAALDAVKTNIFVFSRTETLLLCLGFILSFITAYISVKFLLDFVKKHNFMIFGYYRIILSLLYFVRF